jgi:predicted alpha/beta-hydrolase family hydrolase
LSGVVDALLLMPGAGAGRDQPALVAVESAGPPFTVVRRDFGYHRAGRRFPDRAPELVTEFDGIVADVLETSAIEVARLAVGGRSMGGRIASMWAAGRSVGPAAVVLISYPLHPPGRPERLRTGHFGDLAVPCLFVSGTRDDFGTPDELAAATGAIGAPVRHEWIEGARHDLRGRDAEVADRVVSYLCGLDAG